MKASEAHQVLSRVRLLSDDLSLVVMKSSVDETKTLNQMLMSWSQLFQTYPDMQIKSIMRYNVNRDFNCL